VEIRELYLFFKAYIKLMLLTGLAFGALGVAAFYFYPQTHVATGSFFVSRAAQSGSPDYFTYEGFYSQQSALSFTETVIGLMESVDIRKAALATLGSSPTEESLRRVAKITRVKKAAPQLITLQVKEKSPVAAGSTWLALSSATLAAVDKIKASGDLALQVSLLQETPVIAKTYRNVFVNFFGGFGAGTLLFALGVSIRKALS